MKASAISTSTRSVSFLHLAAVLALVLFVLTLPFLITGPAYQHPDMDIVGP
jgi:hypothetical protein